jgi:hypothetical protein
VTLPCFLQTLQRPLSLYATSSPISAQPADSERDPRIFVMMEPLILSVVAVGETSVYLELSELTSNTRSIKAEITAEGEGG